MFEKVQLGEEKYILPYKCYAEYDIDTFLPYETAVYKNFLMEDLTALRNFGGFGKYEDLMIILEELDIVLLENVPADSLVREFTGGSIYEY
jgi:uridine kinase